MAATLASQLLDKDMVDLVLCFSPSVIVAHDFQRVLEERTGSRMDGLLGSHGRSLTYQAMLSLDGSFWALFDAHRIFVIFDEIHHCAGEQLDNANSWGQKIIKHIQGRATFTLALTGTPWRSDKIPIALSSYCEDNRIHCDFTYGLAQAVSQKVCRSPQFNVIDNDRVIFQRSDGEAESYSSISELLKKSRCPYHSVIDNDELIIYILKQSAKKLTQLRRHYPRAGGLIVAASVEHAHKISALLERHLNERASVATYMEEDALSVINRFKESSQPWIISVGMISEGTDIPRLRVCCHLTRVKTELHFRQVLGRILRVTDGDTNQSYLYMPAEPSLIDFAKRISQEIPESVVVRRETMSTSDSPQITIEAPNHQRAGEFGNITFGRQLSTGRTFSDEPSSSATSALSRAYDSTLNIFGRFKQELLQLSYGSMH